MLSENHKISTRDDDGTVVRGGDGGLVVHGHGVLRNNEQQQHNRV